MSNDIIAFAIDKHIRWAKAVVNKDGIVESKILLYKEIIETNPEELAKQFADYIDGVIEKYPDIKAAKKIGVSTIGPVDDKKVWNIPRKGWETPNAKKPLIEFDKILCKAFPDLTPNDIRVQNDATCAAFAEWYFREDKKTDYSRWLYVTINENGINCGLTRFDAAHPEMGHIFPRIHADDPFDPEKHSGCTHHTWCLESVASAASMQKRWGDNWSSNEQAWRLEAWYVGQFCLNAMLAFQPEIIVLGGYVVQQNPDFLPMVRDQFEQLNAGYVRNPRIESRAALDKYIIKGRLKNEVNVIGALVLVCGAPSLRRIDGGLSGN